MILKPSKPPLPKGGWIFAVGEKTGGYDVALRHIVLRTINPSDLVDFGCAECRLLGHLPLGKGGYVLSKFVQTFLIPH